MLDIAQVFEQSTVYWFIILLFQIYNIPKG